MVNWEGLNRRQFPRINYPCLVIIHDGDEDSEDGKNSTILTHTDNVGIGGVCVVLKQGVKMFSTVTLELDLLDLGDHICCNGKVIWNVQRQGGIKEKPLFFDIGIEFIDITEKDQERLKKVVEHLIKNDI